METGVVGLLPAHAGILQVKGLGFGPERYLRLYDEQRLFDLVTVLAPS